MSAETLRRAAERMRTDVRLNAWTDDDDRTFIGAVADWLDDEAEGIPPGATHCLLHGGIEAPIEKAPAVRVARAYLGEQP